MAFNGGKSQLGFNYFGLGFEFAFLNLAKGLANWQLAAGGDWPSPDTLDANGYPVSVSGSPPGVSARLYIPRLASRSGNYVLKWTSAGGTTTVTPGAAETPVSGSTTATGGANGRYVFTPGTNIWNLTISTVGVSNLVVCHVNDEAALTAGQVFGVQFKQRLMEGNCGVLRFMNWQQGNTTNVTTWATRKPLSYYTYAGDEYRPSLYATSQATLSGSAYSCTLPGFALVDKATVIVRFATSHSGAATLNVNGTGARNMLNEYAQGLSGYGPIGVDTAPYASMGTVTYDATLSAWIKKGADQSRGSQGLVNGVPLELMVQLCNEVSAHPWFTAPPLSLDPMTDYFPQLAAYCRDNGWSGMIPRYETPNETWNTAGGFDATPYAVAKATAYNATDASWGADEHQWLGKTASTLGQAIATVYSVPMANVQTQNLYQVLCGVQTARGDTIGDANNAIPRLESTSYLAQTAAPQSPYLKSASKNWVTHITTTQYITPGRYGANQELSDAWAYTMLGTTSKAADYLDTLGDTAANAPFGIAGLLVLATTWKTFAQAHGISKMSGYEGGYSPDYYPGETNSALNNELGGVRSPSSLITAASAASPCVLTFSTTYQNSYVNTGNPAVVGMPLVITNMTGTMGTKLVNPDHEAVTFTAGSPNISGANTLLLNQAVYFYAPASGGSFIPTDLTRVSRVGTAGMWSIPYWVVQTGNPFRISATRGGTAITFANAGFGFTYAQEAWFVSAVAGNNVTIDVDTTGLSATISGTTKAIYGLSVTMINNLRYNSKLVTNSPLKTNGMYDYTLQNYNQFVGLTGGGFTAEFPSCYQFTGATPSESVWSVLEDIYQTPDPPQWNAIKAFNAIVSGAYLRRTRYNQ